MNATPKKPAVKKAPKAAKPAAAPRKRAVKKEEAPVAVATAAVEKIEKAEEKKLTVPKTAAGQNYYAVGKRKTAVAQVILTVGTGAITVNELPIEGYFQTADLQNVVNSAATSIGIEKNINVRAKVHGGGIHAQAEAMRHAISRALLLLNPEVRRTLKKQGFLTRDPRVKERKKPGLKRARRAPQFSKR
jgi:small subunit ribosomal protein S9